MGAFDRIRSMLPQPVLDVANVGEEVAEEGLSGPVSVAAGLALPAETTVRSGFNVGEEQIEAPLVEIERAKDRAEKFAKTAKTVGGLLAAGAITALAGVAVRAFLE